MFATRHALLCATLGLLGLAVGPAQGHASAATACQLAPSGPASAAPSEFGRRADGTITMRGQPFFPLGFYHVSWGKGGTAAQRLGDIGRLGSSGFNVIFTEPINDRDVATYRNMLTHAQRNGVYVVSYGLSPVTVRQIADHPAVMGFKIADDSNVLSTPAELRARHGEVRRLAPDKLSYTSLSVGFQRPELDFFGNSDLVGNQSYPIGNDNINVTYPVMKMTVENSRQRGNTPVANLQTFAWEGGPVPQGQELRNMTYQALMAGVKGVVYYAYRSVEMNLSEHPALWQAASNVACEVNALSPALLNSRPIELSDGRGGRPVVVAFNGPGGSYLMALNNSRGTAQTVDVSLPAAPAAFRPMWANTPSLRLNGQRLQGQLAPLEVAVYRLQ